MQVCPVAEDARDRPRGGGLQVGIGEHDVGRLSAELEGHPLDLARGRLVDLRAGDIGSREGDLGDIRVLHDGAASLAAIAGDDIEHPIRQPRLLGQAGEFQGAGGCEFRGLDHHGAARCEGGRAFPGHEQQR